MIPWTKQYELSIILFLVQGLATALYDLGGNNIILKLWQGVSTSPINAMHAGYGIGALIALHIAKPFIKFDPIKSLKNIEEMTNYNQTLFLKNLTFNKIKSEDIQVVLPYSISASIGILISTLLIIAQILEIKNTKKFDRKMGSKLLVVNVNEINHKYINSSSLFQKLLFDKKEFKGKSLCYMLVQILLLTFVFFFLQGYITVSGKFMLTYLTKGPGKFSIETYSQLQTLYWSIFVVSRLLAAFFAFKIDPIIFVFSLFLFNLITCFLFIIPYFTQMKMFFWISIPAMGLFSGPMLPSAFMIAKTFLVKYNSFIISIFLIGNGLGGIFFQQVTGNILDYFKPSNNFLGYEDFQPAYLISHAFFIPSLISFLFLIPIYLIYKKHVHLIK